MNARGFVIALLGAESTGKTTLAQQLRDALATEGHDAVTVGEVLREFCDRHARTPRPDEQRAIAAEQTRRIDAAAASHALVVADTTALMTAVYSDQVFGDGSLYTAAEAGQRRCDLTLLMALDIPWQADGLQRDGPKVRDPVDAKVRAALLRSRTPFSVVSGIGPARLAAALDATRRALDPPRSDHGASRWQWVCEHCGDSECERSLLPREAPGGSPPARG